MLESNPDSLIDSLQERDRWLDLVAAIQAEDAEKGIEINVIKHTPVLDRALHLYPIGDFHVGHRLHAADRLRPLLDYILEDPDGYVILLGDQAEAATKTSVGMAVYDESEHVNQQIERLYHLLLPLAEAGKIVGIHEGNHEYRIQQLVSIDPMQWLARWLGVPYLGWQAFTEFQVGDQSYLVHSFHGRSSAQTPGGLINAAYKLMHHVEADIYLSGHVHDPIYDSTARFVRKPGTNKMVKKYYHFFICTAWLDYFGGYADMKALRPSMIKPMRLRLMADKHHVYVE